MKRFLGFLCCLALLLGLSPAKTALAVVDWPSGVSISADGGILMDANSGAVLYGKNIHEQYYPASITKILTALVILENCSLDDTVTFSYNAVNNLEPNSTILGARAGDTLSVRDCLYALLLQSANEVANALAEHCSGDIESFAELMNRKAESLGCTDSHFANPSGLNDENHYTSAHDMALIAQAAFNNPTFVEIDSTTYYDVQPGQLVQYPDGWRYYAHHRMMKKNDSVYYDGIIGGKTGYTSLAGNTLVTCAERDGLKLITVVLNGHQTHYDDTKALLDFGFENFQAVAIADKEDTYQKIEDDLTVNGIFSGSAVRLSIDENSSIVLPAGGDFSDVTSTLNYQLESGAPESAVARIDYQYGDQTVGHAYLKASVLQGYVPEAGTISGNSSGNPTENSSGDPSSGLSSDGETAAGSADGAEDEEVFNGSGSITGEPAGDPALNADPETEESSGFSIFGILKTILLIAAILAAAGAAIFGVLYYRERREEQERLLRRKRREKRLKEWGYSSTEFDLLMEEHLRSKNRFKKRSLADRIRSWFRRR